MLSKTIDLYYLPARTFSVDEALSSPSKFSDGARACLTSLLFLAELSLMLHSFSIQASLPWTVWGKIKNNDYQNFVTNNQICFHFIKTRLTSLYVLFTQNYTILLCKEKLKTNSKVSACLCQEIFLNVLSETGLFFSS
jgi:hypothetical protein